MATSFRKALRGAGFGALVIAGALTLQAHTGSAHPPVAMTAAQTGHSMQQLAVMLQPAPPSAEPLETGGVELVYRGPGRPNGARCNLPSYCKSQNCDRRTRTCRPMPQRR